MVLAFVTDIHSSRRRLLAASGKQRSPTVHFPQHTLPKCPECQDQKPPNKHVRASSKRFYFTKVTSESLC